MRFRSCGLLVGARFKERAFADQKPVHDQATGQTSRIAVQDSIICRTEGADINCSQAVKADLQNKWLNPTLHANLHLHHRVKQSAKSMLNC
ncbi:hypothetical protein U9M48_029009 [Paspalum notatum var. saurae]|uniref:Uncharacterized protein n=1 Tax=Paspalum notatum var. saurae TaxID=547442 RepID=A0AAQ3X2B2_PASNO